MKKSREWLTLFLLGINWLCRMWKIQPTDRWDRDQRHYVKKHPDELAAVMRNLGRYLDLLKNAKNPMDVRAGFLHPEGNGILAIDQKGSRGNLQETRLYTFADRDNCIVYLIAIGNKDSQQCDLQLSRRFVASLKQETD